MKADLEAYGDRSGLYQIVNLRNGKRYIGQTAHFKKRYQAHLCALRNGRCNNQHLQRAWAKYGEGSFEFRILILCRPSLLDEQERAALGPILGTAECYNSVAGGAPGPRGQKQAATLVEQRVAPLRGRRRTNEQRARMSAAQQRRATEHPETFQGVSGPANHRHGKPAFNRGVAMSPERLAIHVASCVRMLGRPVTGTWPDGHMETFLSIKDAARQNSGCFASGISACCRGIMHRHHSIQWRYASNLRDEVK